jgi:hypothetical protein
MNTTHLNALTAKFLEAIDDDTIRQEFVDRGLVLDTEQMVDTLRANDYYVTAEEEANELAANLQADGHTDTMLNEMVFEDIEDWLKYAKGIQFLHRDIESLLDAVDDDELAGRLTRAGRLVAADGQEDLVSKWLMERDWATFMPGHNQEYQIAMYLSHHEYLCIRRDDQMGNNLAHSLDKIGGKGFRPGEGIHGRAMQWAADGGAALPDVACNLTDEELLAELRRRMGV